MPYLIIKKNTDEVLDSELRYSEALDLIKEYEQFDKENNTFKENSYQIKEIEDIDKITDPYYYYGLNKLNFY